MIETNRRARCNELGTILKKISNENRSIRNEGLLQLSESLDKLREAFESTGLDVKNLVTYRKTFEYLGEILKDLNEQKEPAKEDLDEIRRYGTNLLTHCNAHLKHYTS